MNELIDVEGVISESTALRIDDCLDQLMDTDDWMDYIGGKWIN